MREITEWFQGSSICEGLRAVPAPSVEARCLWMATDSGQTWDGRATAETEALAGIIARLFPDLACRCVGANADSSARLIHFNNHPSVTRDLIDKVVATYRLEAEE